MRKEIAIRLVATLLFSLMMQSVLAAEGDLDSEFGGIGTAFTGVGWIAEMWSEYQARSAGQFRLIPNGFRRIVPPTRKANQPKDWDARSGQALLVRREYKETIPV